jgi:hypothetical protein
LADLARQTKAWYKGLSFEKDPSPAEKDPSPAVVAAKLPEEAARARTRSRKGLLLTVPELVAVTVLEPTNHFPVTTAPEGMIRAVMSPTKVPVAEFQKCVGILFRNVTLPTILG